MNIQELFPKVLRKSNSPDVIEEVYDPKKIAFSIVEETTLDADQSLQVTTEASRFILTLNLPFLTAPMIREIVCIIMLKMGFVKQRFQYTRIGFPFADVTKIVQNNGHLDDTCIEIAEHVLSEWKAVQKAIEKVEESKKV